MTVYVRNGKVVGWMRIFQVMGEAVGWPLRVIRDAWVTFWDGVADAFDEDET